MTASPQRIVHFLMDARRAGPLVVVENLCAEQRKDARAEVWTCGRSEITNRALLVLRSPWRALYLLEMVVNTLVILFSFLSSESRRGLVFHVHGEQNFAPVLVAAWLEIPVVWHFHSTVDVYGEGSGRLSGSIFALLRGWVITALHQTRHAFIASARATRQTWKLPDSTAVVPTPIDATLWAPDPNASQRDGLHALCVANLYPLKGQDILMRAMHLVGDEGLRVTLVGDVFPVHREFSDQVQALSAGLNVTMAGPQSGEQVRAMMAQAGLLVLPSRSEACPVALIEAAAMGLCVVATRVGDVEVLVGDDYPLLAEPDDAADLARVLRVYLGMLPEERRRLSTALRKRVVARCEVRSVVQQTNDVYASLVS